jgi:hypothetical protein
VQVDGNVQTAAKHIFRLDDAGVLFQVLGDANLEGARSVDDNNM